MRFKLRPWHWIVLTPLLLFGGQWFYYWYQSTALRLRLTVTVDDNGIERIGSSVVEMEYQMQPPSLLSSSRYNEVFHYEAPIIDLKEKGYLFALIDVYVPKKGIFNFSHILFDYQNSYGLMDPKLNEKDAISRLRSLGERTMVLLTRGNRDNEKGNVLPKTYPVFACFKDPKDFTSLQVPAPDNLEECFGKGVWINTVSIEVTDDPLTNRHIENLMSLTVPYAWRLSLPKDDPRREIFPHHFKQGLPNN